MNDELLIKFLLRETDPDEDRLVKEWIESDPGNTKHFSQIATIWKSSKELAPHSRIDPDEAWSRFKARRDTAATAPKVVVLPSRPRYFLRIAAALLVAAAGAWSVYSYLQPDVTTLASLSDVKTSMLPDGSTIVLNKNSVVSYPQAFDDERRLIELDEGEVFFNVHPDKARPFIINADDVTVTVVGTSFNVKHSSEMTDVIVETGVVEVKKGVESVTLTAGEKVTIEGKNGPLTKEKITDRLHNYYRSKEFVASNTPLWRMIEVLNEAYQTNIVIQEPAVKNLTLTTTFKNESLDNILLVISETFDLTVERRGDTIILK